MNHACLPAQSLLKKHLLPQIPLQNFAHGGPVNIILAVADLFGMARCVIAADFEHRAFEQAAGCVAQRPALELHIAGDARPARCQAAPGGQLGMPQRP